jgi:Family of unknown function (DUF5519)
MVNCRRRSSARCSTDRSLEEEQRRRPRRDRRHRLEVRRPQIGYVHDNGVAGFQFLKALHDELIRDGRAKPHPLGFPNIVSYRVRGRKTYPKPRNSSA